MLDYILVLLYFLIIILIHEIGQVVCGLIKGYEFVFFRVFNYMLIKKNGKLFIKKDFALNIISPVKNVMVPKLKENGNYSFFAYNFGGLFLNLVVAICISLFFSNRILLIDEFYFKQLFMFVFETALFIIINIIPFKIISGTDMYKYINYKKNDNYKKRIYKDAFILRELADGKNLNDFKEEFFSIPKEEWTDKSKILDVYQYWMYLIITKKEENTEELEEILLNSSNLVVEGEIGKHFLVKELLEQNRPEIISKYYTKKLQGYIINVYTIENLLAKYVIELLMHDNYEKSENLRKKLERKTKNYPYESTIENVNNLVKQAQAKYNGGKESC